MGPVGERSKPMGMKFPFTATDKGMYVLDGIFNATFHCILEIQGSIQMPLLAKAIDYALAKTPILKSIARLRGITSYWEVIGDLSPYTILTVKDVSQEWAGAEKTKELVHQYLNEPLDITREPPARFLLIRTSADRCIFINKVHHCALDGKAAFHLIRDIQDAYEKLLRDDPLPALAEMRDRGRWLLVKSVPLSLWVWLLSEAMMEWVRHEREERRVCYPQFSASQPLSDTISYRSLRLAGEDYQQFLSRCRSLGVTFNDLVITSVCRAIHRWNQSQGTTGGIYSFIMPIDLRKYVERNGQVPRIMSNYVGGSLITIPAAVVTTVTEMAEHVARNTRFIRNRHIALRQQLRLPLLSFLPPRWLRERMKRFYQRDPGRFVPTAVVSNFGKLDSILSTFAHCHITGIDIILAAVYSGSFLLALSSYQEVCHLTFTYLQSVCSEPEIDEFLQLVSYEMLPDREGGSQWGVR